MSDDAERAVSAQEDEPIMVESTSTSTTNDGDVPPSSSSAAVLERSTLFVGDVARNATEKHLRQVFSSYGDVVKVDLKRDKNTKVGLGYAFVSYRTRPEALAAKVALDKTVICNRSIRLGWAQRNTNVFVGDVDPSLTTEDIEEAFGVHGPILNVVLHRNYGFVRFRDRESAERAKKGMDGVVVGGKAVRTGWGEGNSELHSVHVQFDLGQRASGKNQGSGSSGSDAAATATTDAATPPPTSDGDGSWPAVEVLEPALRETFEVFGDIESLALPVSREGGHLRGFAFVRYTEDEAGEAAALAAIRKLNGGEIAGIPVLCNFGKRQSPRKQQRDEGGGGGGGGGGGSADRGGGVGSGGGRGGGRRGGNRNRGGKGKAKTRSGGGGGGSGRGNQVDEESVAAAAAAATAAFGGQADGTAMQIMMPVSPGVWQKVQYYVPSKGMQEAFVQVPSSNTSQNGAGGGGNDGSAEMVPVYMPMYSLFGNGNGGGGNGGGNGGGGGGGGGMPMMMVANPASFAAPAPARTSSPSSGGGAGGGGRKKKRRRGGRGKRKNKASATSSGAVAGGTPAVASTPTGSSEAPPLPSGGDGKA